MLLEGGAPFEGYLENSPETPDCEYSILSLYMIDTWGDGLINVLDVVEMIGLILQG